MVNTLHRMQHNSLAILSISLNIYTYIYIIKWGHNKKIDKIFLKINLKKRSGLNSIIFRVGLTKILKRIHIYIKNLYIKTTR